MTRRQDVMTRRQDVMTRRQDVMTRRQDVMTRNVTHLFAVRQTFLHGFQRLDDLRFGRRRIVQHVHAAVQQLEEIVHHLHLQRLDAKRENIDTSSLEE